MSPERSIHHWLPLLALLVGAGADDEDGVAVTALGTVPGEDEDGVAVAALVTVAGEVAVDGLAAGGGYAGGGA